MNDLDDTKRRILEAAGPVFAEKGYQAATIREICQRAAVNLAAINYHFGDKERLYIEAVKQVNQATVQRISVPGLPTDLSPEARLRIFVRMFLTHVVCSADSSWHSQLMMRELTNPTAALAEVVREFIQPHFTRLNGILEEMLPPHVTAERRHLIAFSIVGQCLYHHIAAPVVKMLISAEEHQHFNAEYLADHITRFSLAAIAQLAAGDQP